MDIRIQTWLLDILQCVNEINQFLGENIDFIAYEKDLKTNKAVERNIEIIGEAVSKY
jgi:uncharacterized protein with HEPN domain